MSEPFRKNPPITSFRQTVIRWTLICTVSAAPSFYFGYFLIATHHIPAMLLGVATFIVFYIALDWGTRFHPLRQNRWVHGGLVFGFTTRLLISFIPHVFSFTDGLLGIWSIRIATGNWFEIIHSDETMLPAELTSFFQVYATTIVHGILLNIILYLWIFVVVGIVWSLTALFKALTGTSRNAVP